MANTIRKDTVFEIIRKNPGIRFNQIMHMSDIRNGTLSYYVKKLEDEKSIELHRTPRVTRLYPIGISEEEAKICKCLHMPTKRKIILFLMKKYRNHEVATSIEIRHFLKKSPSVVSVNLSELFREKIINKEYDIPSNKYSLKNSKEVRGVLNEYYPNLVDSLSENMTEMLNY